MTPKSDQQESNLKPACVLFKWRPVRILIWLI